MRNEVFFFLLLPSIAFASDCTQTAIGGVPINDLGSRTYLNQFSGGLYPMGENHPPARHHNDGLNQAAAIQPLAPDGRPAADGAVVLLSIGMSNAAIEFRQFVRTATNHPDVNHETLAVVNGAQGGADAQDWRLPNAQAYDDIRSHALEPAGLSEFQVQAVWVKVANGHPEIALPEPNADAFNLVESMGDIARALRERYPNLRLAFFSSRTYAGYATTTLNPEPYAYESAFAVKWTVEAQINQRLGLGADPLAGDLRYPERAPWVAWGPYLWADGERPRSDGLQWFCDDFQSDGTHPSRQGAEAVAQLLFDFFMSSPYTASWFRADGMTGATEPEIVVQSPNGGETLIKGSEHTIRWNSSETTADAVNIVLRQYPHTLIVAEGAPNTGGFLWTVPTHIPDSTQCIIEIESAEDASVSDTSDNVFAIVAEKEEDPAITLISPNGGETLIKGTTHQIEWSTTGDTGSTVSLQLRLGDKSRTIARGIQNDGAYTWQVPHDLPNRDSYSLTITSDADPSLGDDSDDVFSITD